MCMSHIVTIYRPYELLSEAVAMGNSKAKEQIGYFYLVRTYRTVVSSNNYSIVWDTCHTELYKG